MLAPLFVPEPPRGEGHLDLRGGLLSTTGLALLIYGFIRIGEGGSSVEVIVGLFEDQLDRVDVQEAQGRATAGLGRDREIAAR